MKQEAEQQKNSEEYQLLVVTKAQLLFLKKSLSFLKIGIDSVLVEWATSSLSHQVDFHLMSQSQKRECWLTVRVKGLPSGQSLSDILGLPEWWGQGDVPSLLKEELVSQLEQKEGTIKRDDGEVTRFRKRVAELEQERDSLYADVEAYIYLLRDVKRASIPMEVFVPAHLMERLQELLDEENPV